jgi:succinoglycan biosynthesis protein ExoA
MDEIVVTVVMPIRNEAQYIERALLSVLAQDFGLETMEIIVADGMSTDGTREIVAALQSHYPNLHLIDNPGRIASTGLNAAIRRARGKIIVRVDGHCEIATDYVSRCINHLAEENITGVGGPVETVGEDRFSAAVALAMSSNFGVGGSAFRTVKDRSLIVDTVAFPAYTRDTIVRAGFYDTELVRNQDDEFNYRLNKLGGRILLASDIRSRYYSRSSARALWRQYFEYGYWKVRVMQKHPGQMRWRQFVPPMFVVALLLSLSIMPFFGFADWIFLSIVCLYVTLTLLASVLAVRKGQWQSLHMLPLIYATLHLSYGTGFIWGLVAFWKRWLGDTHLEGKTVTGQ